MSDIDGMHVVVEVPASVANLGPGFDTLGMALQLYNRYEFRLTPTGVQVAITGEGAAALPLDESHLACQAFAYVYNQLGLPLPGLALVQHNNIPLAGGLGNSATAVVAGVVAANAFAGQPLTQQELLNAATAVEGHPDNVGPALLGGLLVCGGTSCINCVQIPIPEALRVVLAVPNYALDTKLARKVLPSHVPRTDAVFNVNHTAMLTAALFAGRYDLLATAMQDSLHQPYRAHLIPGFTQVCEAAQAAGALGACLAGAGPTVMALTLDVGCAALIGTAMVQAFSAAGVSAHYLVAEPCRKGARMQQVVAAHRN